MNKKPVIAIDGFSSTGKSSISKVIAQKLDLIHIDTGALYRGITYFALENCLNDSQEIDIKSLFEKFDQIHLEFILNNGVLELFLNGKNIDKEIANLKAQIDEAISKLPEGVEINEEVSELQTKLQLTENYKDFLVKRHEFGLTQELSEEGRKVLARPDTFIADNEAALNTYANSYIDFLNYLKTNSLYTDVTDVDLVALMKSYFYVNGFTEGIAAAN